MTTYRGLTACTCLAQASAGFHSGGATADAEVI